MSWCCQLSQLRGEARDPALGARPSAARTGARTWVQGRGCKETADGGTRIGKAGPGGPAAPEGGLWRGVSIARPPRHATAGAGVGAGPRTPAKAERQPTPPPLPAQVSVDRLDHVLDHLLGVAEHHHGLVHVEQL